jgi:type IX secretion system PorP/SprF family membrane protein
MKKLNPLHIVFVLLLTSVFSYAQQLPQFSQYMYNTIAINPAYAGSREKMVINLLGRNQWVGIEGAPITQTLSAHTIIPNTNFGVGLSVINDKLAFENTTYVFTDLSYTVNLTDKYRLAFGVKLGASKYSLDNELLNDPQYNGDPFLNNLNFEWSPNFGAGLYFRSDYFYLGLSIPKIIDYGNRTNIDYVAIDRASYYFNGGYLMRLNNKVQFKPTFLVKYTNGAPMTVDINANFLLNETLWLGAFYRFTEAVGVMANLKVNDNLSFGYAYDYLVSDLNPYSSGSHELVLNYELNFPKPKCNCPDLYN